MVFLSSYHSKENQIFTDSKSPRKGKRNIWYRCCMFRKGKKKPTASGHVHTCRGVSELWGCSAPCFLIPETVSATNGLFKIFASCKCQHVWDLLVMFYLSFLIGGKFCFLESINLCVHRCAGCGVLTVPWPRGCPGNIHPSLKPVLSRAWGISIFMSNQRSTVKSFFDKTKHDITIVWQRHFSAMTVYRC